MTTATIQNGIGAADHAVNRPLPVDTVGTEECQTSFYFTLASQMKPTEEVFVLAFSVRGNPSPVKIRAHLTAVRNACAAVLELGGHARPAGPQASPPAAKPYSFRTGERGRRYIVLPAGQADPEEITCDIHNKRMSRKVNDYGVFWAHRDGADWCRIAKPEEG